ncbi:MAG: hypothetical protein ACRD2N_05140 [Vicinamibacterales bacterium]
MRLTAAMALLTTIATSIDCSGVLSRKYEYEEEIYLALDGSATVFVNAAVPALVTLRAARLPLDPRARLDRRVVADFFESPVSHVASVTLSRRDRRRYVHVRIDVPDIRQLSRSPAFAWSAYRFDSRDGVMAYAQTVNASAERDVGNVGWSGRELVAFKLHLPSRVPFHNAPSRSIERGNIIIWDQPLADRVTGVPVDIQVQMEPQSILIRTLTLFGLMMLVVAATFVGFIWVLRRRGRAETVP